MERFFPHIHSTALLVIDVQERISAVMHPEELEAVTTNIIRLLKGMELMGGAHLFTEQYPKGLGPTIEALQPYKSQVDNLEKLYFSCCRDLPLVERLQEQGIASVVLAGMETHVCVLQTALDLIKEGFFVHVVRDAVISRQALNKETGLRFMENAGAVVTTTETLLFQLQERCGTEQFKQISRLVR